MNRVFGGILLVSGSCIGAGMLGLPISTGIAGFVPALAMVLLTGIFMIYTGLLLLEVNLWYGEGVSIVSMAGKSLGRWGKVSAWLVYIFLFYSLMVAYISGSSALFGGFLKDFVDVSPPSWLGGLFFVILFGFLTYLGTSAVDRFNRYFMLGLVVAYIIIMILGSAHVSTDLLSYKRWRLAPFIVPVIITTFGFHNLIPSLTTYLKGDRRKLVTVIVVGGTIPLAMYILWEWLILGIVPVHGVNGMFEAMREGILATNALRLVVGNTAVVVAAQSFSFFAIVTSFLGVSLSFVDFLADGLKVEKNTAGKIVLCCLVLLPPYIFSLSYPHVFITALNYAGGFGATLLFWIFPVMMVWSVRRKRGELTRRGSIALVLVLIFAIAVMGLELAQELGVSPLAAEYETISETEPVDLL